MDDKVSADAVRLAVSSAKTCKADTPETLRRLLDTTDDKENLPKPSQAPANKTNARTKASAPLASRAANPRLPSKTGKPVLTAKERQNLATEAVNSCLKALSAELRERSATEETARSTPASSSNHKSSTSPVSSTQRRDLDNLARCARIAFSFLRNVSSSPSDQKDLKLEHGTLALCGKFIVLDLREHAIRELFSLKQRLHHRKPEERCKAAADATADDLLCIHLEATTTDQLALAWSHQTIVLRLLCRPGTSFNSHQLVESLHPENPDGPRSLLLKMLDLGSKAGDVSQHLESLAQLLRSLAKVCKASTVSPGCASAEAAFALEMIALDARRTWWPLARHNVDFLQDLFAPIESGLRLLRKSAIADATQWELSCKHAGKILRQVDSTTLAGPALDQYKQLCLALSDIADAAGQSQDAQSWITKTGSAEDNGLAVIQLRRLLLTLRSSKLLPEASIVQINEALAVIASSRSPCSSAELKLCLDIQRLCAKAIMAASAADDTNIVASLAESLIICHSIIGSQHGSQHISLATEGALLACERLLQLKPPSWKAVEEAEQKIRTSLAAVDPVKDARLWKATSSLQWRLYKHHLTTDISPERCLAMLKSSLRALKRLTAKDQDDADYLNKLFIAISEHSTSRSYTSAASYLASAVNYVPAFQQDCSEVQGDDAVLVSLRNTMRDPQAHSLIMLAIRIGGEVKSGWLASISDSLGTIRRMPFFLAYLMCPGASVSTYQKGNLNFCATWLLDNLAPYYNQVGHFKIAVRVLFLSLLLPNTIDAEIMARIRGWRLTRQASTKRMSQQVTNLEHCYATLEALRFGNVSDATVVRALHWWADITKGEVTTQSTMDDPQQLIDLLLLCNKFFDLHALLGLQRIALDICKRLLPLLDSDQDDKIAQVHMQLCRLEFTQNNSSAVAALLESPDLVRLGTEKGFNQDKLTLLCFQLEQACASDHPGSIDFILGKSVTSMNLHGLRRAQKMSVYRFQARVGITVAGLFFRQCRHPESSSILQATLALLRSIMASTKESLDAKANGTDGVRESPGAPDEVVRIVGKLGDLSLTADVPPERPSGEPDLSIDACHDTMSTIRCLSLLVQASSQQGMYEDAASYLQQATRMATAIAIPIAQRLVNIERLRLEVLSQSKSDGEPEVVDSLPVASGVDAVDTVASKLSIASGDWRAKFDDLTRALTEYEKAESCLLVDPCQESNMPSATVPAKMDKALKAMTKAAGKVPSKPLKSAAAKTTTKPRSAVRPGTKKAVAVEIQRNEPSVSESRFDDLLASIQGRRIVALIKQGQLDAAKAVLADTVTLQSKNPELELALTRLSLEEIIAALTADVTYSSLDESTLAVPTTMMQSEEPQDASSERHKGFDIQRLNGANAGNVSGLLATAKQHYSMGDGSARNDTLYQAYEKSGLMASLHFFESAIAVEQAPHPNRLAMTLESPADQAFRQQIAHAADHRRKLELLQSLQNLQTIPHARPITNFQTDYIDILPTRWTVVSLSLNEKGTELWAARYAAGQAPFIVRLPMCRSRHDDIDEGVSFTFDVAREELADIIKQSDLSCHNPPDSSIKGGKTKWWDEREALDERMRTLLVNMEDIWLGGFKSILSLQQRQPEVLARFGKTFDSILGRHLPSRRSAKGVRKRYTTLHSHVLSLFVGLPIDVEAEEQLDEHVMDLLFFVVDILCWHGEKNAYDEIDFDEMAVQTIDAIKAYHDAADAVEMGSPHMILRLDKRLHAFPWESLPHLDGRSVSRVGSMLQLRERILSMRRGGNPTDQHARISAANGAYMLNPSGDLTRTQATLSPHLAPLSQPTPTRGAWQALIQRKPDEPFFAAALAASDVLLYFGHGSGAQYVRRRTLEALPRCAPVVWLMGCSSGAAAEHGELETTSVPLSYLTAGSPAAGERDARGGLCLAVVAALWDVTDRDIDRFSVAVGRKWGLFRAPDGANSGRQAAPPRTPARRKAAAAPPQPRTPKTPGARAAPVRNRATKTVEGLDDGEGGKMCLSEAVARSRDVCYLRYLNGAASVVYGVPVWLED